MRTTTVSLRETLRTSAYVETLSETVAVARRAQISLLAASLAYFGFLSLFPFALLVIIVLTTLGGEYFGDVAADMLADVLGEQISRQFDDEGFITNAGLPSTLGSLAVLLWGSMRLYWSSDQAFAAIYGEHDDATLVSTLRNASLVFLTNLAAIVLLGGIGIWFGLSGRTAALVAPLLLFFVLIAVFLPVFYIFPHVDVTVREILPGTVLAAGVWAVASSGFRVYAGSASTVAYGVAGAIVLLLSWLYIVGLATLVGAALNAVLGGHVDPDDEWVPTDYM
ncbi:YihY/virulence factor BrkB family protein [Natronomonas amylolytica]|uniref:YihY/virulence factor BrkB family protein n=1 Tax=Natronomonas amylolytica TaxID=3108498 RepID=UPI0030092EF3